MAIDPDMQDFVDASERFYPPDAASRPLREQRRLYDAYARAFAVSRPAGIESQDAILVVGERRIPLRRYREAGRPSNGMILYAHGGGFVLGSLDSHDGIVARLAAATAAEVVAVDYRLAPEHPAPAPLDDVIAVVEAAAQDGLAWPVPGPLLLAGDSAGGTLMASAALRLAARVPLAGVALFYPALGFEPAEPARTTEAAAPMLTLADVHAYRDLYLGGRAPAPGTYPLDAPDLTGFPPCLLLGAEHDPLRDDSTAFAQRLEAAGTPARCGVGAGLVHGFLRAIDRSAAARAAFAEVTLFLTERMRQTGRSETPASKP